MEPRTDWSSGFLTQLLLKHLHVHYPSQMARIDPRSFFAEVEGYETFKDPYSLLMDSHAWIPEPVLREVLRTAEQVSGRKDIAYQAAKDYFLDSSNDPDRRTPFIFEIIARIADDVRTVILSSSLWGSAYTTFMNLQAFSLDPAASELVILCQSKNGFRPLLSNHFMVKGNYEGFVRLYDFVESANLEVEFLQYRIRDIVDEFERYKVKEGNRGITIVDCAKGQTVAVFRPVQLGYEKIPVAGKKVSPEGSNLQGGDEAILYPQSQADGDDVLQVLTSRDISSSFSGDRHSNALQVIRGGCLRLDSLEYRFEEGALYDAPYSRYRFRWKERKRPALKVDGLEKRIQKMIQLLFTYLGELKITQQRMLAYAAENKSLTAENVYLRHEVQEARGGAATKHRGTKSPSMQAVLDLIRQVGPTDSTVLITGETGTGKEIVARMIHHSGERRDARFVAVNCGAIPDGLLESELFGHERGAFTGAIHRNIGKFEWANGGTILLDEIGEIPSVMQVKLLRVLQEREIHRIGGNDPIKLDVRVVAATNQDLLGLIHQKIFRQDLYYRLNVIPVHLPPLRDRMEDLPDLAHYFMVRYTEKLRKNLTTISPLALDLMRMYPWPGNIRELENILERVVTLVPAELTVLTPEILPPEIRQIPEFAGTPSQKAEGKGLIVSDVLNRVEWRAILNAMETEGSMDSFLRKIEWSMARRAITECGSKTEAARVLKRTYRWIRKLEKEMEEKPSA